jgi:hypothetical protein
VFISSDEVFFFQDSEESIYSAEIIDTSSESQADFHWGDFFLKNPITKNQKNVIFQLLQFSVFFLENFRDWSLGK